MKNKFQAVNSKIVSVFKSIGAKPLPFIALAIILAGVFALWLVELKLGIKSANLPTLSDVSRGVGIYDRYDKFVCTVRSDRDREPVPLSRISVNMQKAALAAEDHHFYEHKGIDPVGIVRATLANQKAGHIVQGASTITQQLARNLFLDKNDRSFSRKLKEVLLSWELDTRYSKNKILETYLNEIYFGGGVHGVERAAQYYFNTHADKLTVAQAAFLAGVIRSPSYLGTVQHRGEAIERAKLIIGRMADYKYIDARAASEAASTKLAFKTGAAAVPYPYYIDYVVEIMKRNLGEELNKRDWKVYTNLDVKAQQAASKIMTRGIKAAPYGIDQGALVSMSLSDGAVTAMVGGVGYGKNAWNRALHPHTAGSSFKPFVYLAALKEGFIQPDTMISDGPLSIKTDSGEVYMPRNFDGKFNGWLPVRSALAFSRNTCCVRVAQEVGMNNVVEVARSCGVRSNLETYPAAALGTSAISPLDMATAYATLARGGVYMAPQMVRFYKSTDGKKIKHFYPVANTVVPREAVAQLVDVMTDVVNGGTGTQARLPGIAVAGKTGTADKATDIWFTGFTPDTVTCVWGGNDKVRAVSGNHVTGGAIMARLWREYMTSYYALHSPPRGLALIAPTNPLMREYAQSYAVAKAESSDIFSRFTDRFFHGDAPKAPYDDRLVETEVDSEVERNSESAQGDAPSEAVVAHSQVSPESSRRISLMGIGSLKDILSLQSTGGLSTNQSGSSVAQSYVRNY
jgi:penicillin-binding protein 1A